MIARSYSNILFASETGYNLNEFTMIKGFDDETGKITGIEERAANLIAEDLKNIVGRQMATTSFEIMKSINARGFNITAARLRKIINYIRMKHLVINLVANSDGYYIETDPVKIKEYQLSLTQRANAILAVRDSFKTAA